MPERSRKKAVCENSASGGALSLCEPARLEPVRANVRRAVKCLALGALVCVVAIASRALVSRVSGLRPPAASTTGLAAAGTSEIGERTKLAPEIRASDAPLLSPPSLSVSTRLLAGVAKLRAPAQDRDAKRQAAGKVTSAFDQPLAPPE